MPVFSIIVPVYKTEQYIEKCVTSILNQTYRDFELILIDDGSPDRCPQMCDEYQKLDSRVRVIHKKNGGVSSARNCGLEIACGTFIWFVDSDDYIEPFSLQQLYEAQKEKEADLYVFNTQQIQSFHTADIDEFFEKYYFTYVLGFGPWNKLYRREIIQKNHLGFDVKETIGEDLLFNINYYKTIFRGGQERFFFLGRDYYVYVDRVGSAMNSLSKEVIFQQLRLFDKINENLSEKLKEENITYLFFMHLISGIGQSKQGGLSCHEFSKIDFSKYRVWIDRFKMIQNQFFINENASDLGRMRIQLFGWLMKRKKYMLAGKVMGLK